MRKKKSLFQNEEPAANAANSEDEAMKPRRLELSSPPSAANAGAGEVSASGDPTPGPSRHTSGASAPSPAKRARFVFDITSEEEEEGLSLLVDNPATAAKTTSPAKCSSPPKPVLLPAAKPSFTISKPKFSLKRRRNETGGRQDAEIRGQRLFAESPVPGLASTSGASAAQKPKLIDTCDSPVARRRSEPLPPRSADVTATGAREDPLSKSFTSTLPVRVNTVANINPFTPHTAFYRNRELVPDTPKLAASASFGDPFSTPQVNKKPQR